MDHRKTPSRRAFVPPGWFLVLTVMVCIGAIGWLGWLFASGDDATDDPATPRATSTSRSPSPSTAPTSAATTPTATTPPTTPAVERDVAVSVLNNTTTAGAARNLSTKVEAAGWTVAVVGNWRGTVGTNTVFYPPGREPQARLLAQDLGFGRVAPALAGMSTDRLTAVLSGPQ